MGNDLSVLSEGHPPAKTFGGAAGPICGELGDAAVPLLLFCEGGIRNNTATMATMISASAPPAIFQLDPNGSFSSDTTTPFVTSPLDKDLNDRSRSGYKHAGNDRHCKAFHALDLSALKRSDGQVAG